MINPSLRHVLTFVSLAETQSFRRAAERLRLSQPAVSAHIRELEKQFGVPLVYRTTRHVSLTAEGEAFAARARRALDELDMASQDLRDLAAVQRGRVVVACVPPLMASLVPNVVRRMSLDHPALEVEIHDVLSAQVVQLVARGEADFGIGPRPSDTGLSFALLERDYYVAVVPDGHELASRSAVTLGDLADYPIVGMRRVANARQVLDQATQQRRTPLVPRFEVLHIFSIGRMVEAGLGIAVLPRSALPVIGGSRVATVDIRSPRIHRDIGLITRREYQYSPAARTFVSVLKAMMGNKAIGKAVATGARVTASSPR
jgi:DNA-binding transcriptional LysR family regulator